MKARLKGKERIGLNSYLCESWYSKELKENCNVKRTLDFSNE